MFPSSSRIGEAHEDRAPLHRLILYCHPDQLIDVVEEAAQLVPPRRLAQLLAKREDGLLVREEELLSTIEGLKGVNRDLLQSNKSQYAAGLKSGYLQCLERLPLPARLYLMISKTLRSARGFSN
jgi:hypothetical protein